MHKYVTAVLFSEERIMALKILALKWWLFLALSKTVICQNEGTIDSMMLNSSASDSTSEASTSTSKAPIPISEAPATASKASSATSEVTTTTATASTNTSTLKPSPEDFEEAFPEPPVCGATNATFSRVVGGNDAKIGDFPWVGLIAYNVTGGTGGFTFLCGSSLITPKHSLTAAHCLYGMESRIYFVRLGEWDLADHNLTRPMDAVVKFSYPHENYSTRNFTNDIGILVFYRRVRYTDLVRPICLPLSCELRSKSFVGYTPFVAGWGRLEFQGPRPTRLQVLQLPVVTQDVCKKAYYPIGVVIDKRVLCAGGKAGFDACHGDSGGPLMQPIWNSTSYETYFYQTGVVSLGLKCGTEGYPGVYTRVTEFIPWIQKIVLGTDSTSS